MAKRRPGRRGDAGTVAVAAEEGRPAPRAASASRFPDLWKWALLVAGTFVVYGPCLSGTPVWDDDAHITKPGLQSLHGLWRIWFDLGATQQYYPLLHSAFWIEHRIWGDWFTGYHLVNLLLHALCACLVVRIVRRLELPGAWLAGCLFALHPLNVEAVAWISEQKSTLSGAFCLASLLLYLHFDQSRRRRTYLLAGVLFVLAMLSKSVTATLPAAILVLLWWKRGRIEGKRDVLPLVPWFALALPMGFFTAWVERTYIGAVGSDFALSLVQRVLLAGRVIWFYALKLIFPVNLIFQYPRWKLDAADWTPYLFPASVLLAAVALLGLARRRRGPLAAFLLFTGTLFPVLGFLNVLPFRYSWVADHFAYLAGIALLVPLAYLLTRAASRFSLGREASAIAAGALLAGLGFLSWQQSADFRDDETLYRATLARNSSSWLAHNNLGSVLEARRQLPEAIAEYRAAMRLEPRYPQPHLNLATALAKLDDPARVPEAIAEYQAALRLKPDYAEAHADLANLLATLPDRLPEAIDHYRAAIRIQPDVAQSHANLGGALAQSGRIPEAIEEFQAALRLDPGMAELHSNLGVAFSQAGRIPDAVAEFQAALAINPNLAETHFLLAAALAQFPSRAQDAAAEAQKALELKPSLEPARDLLRQLGGEK